MARWVRQNKLKLNPENREDRLIWKADILKGLDPLLQDGVSLEFSEQVRSLRDAHGLCFSL